MALIQIANRVTYTIKRGSGRSKSFFTMRAAADAMARDIIAAKYPAESADYEDGHLTYPGFHWSGMDRADVMHRRLARFVLTKMKESL